ncbi:MAG: sulfotransferase family protein [Rhodobacteraceae bacterium]|nr:sulfotransferase family protein [Paracoccaceae bacterium]
MTCRIVNLGLPKSGTTTLGTALARAGLRVADHKIRRNQTSDRDLSGSFVGKQIYAGYFETGDPLAKLDMYDALGEISALKPPASFWPQCDYVILQAMRRARPETRFVATRRPTLDIASSMRRWGNLGTQRLPNGTVPGLPHGFGGAPGTLERWITGHYAMLNELFAGDSAFLELDVGSETAAQDLGRHLSLDLPWWGKANQNTSRPETTI